MQRAERLLFTRESRQQDEYNEALQVCRNSYISRVLYNVDHITRLYFIWPRLLLEKYKICACPKNTSVLTGRFYS